ncbi:uncharacterized protein B0P05DRAFT_552299 [Gilbertella persicaria]|uniref:Uncharacterized protein n=1 Tax=Rhizopus stolonifer TaxID=4846 RepID=A0A367IR75_RHIST|nr:uncharacterized protein B0P05DRAFT_552299 [Gilbertella persicaria]KAI8067629.1 hypothetical protein B0P05DRAFT_552299 [Gilbertella persicaria]RCH80136.1 hypothetical protein CU098_001436 [Rhizopus stolonifer]
MSNNSQKAAQKTDQVTDQIRSGAHDAANKVDKALDDAPQQVGKATEIAEDEVNRLKDELADLKRKAGPKIQEAENFLTSPAAINFYKGLITGVALVLTYKKYTDTYTKRYY